jgi:hypothetical protein
MDIRGYFISLYYAIDQYHQTPFCGVETIV